MLGMTYEQYANCWQQQELQACVCGDDVMVYGPREACAKFIKAFPKYYASKDLNGEHGLGQIATLPREPS